MQPLRIGTRGSTLALWQAQQVHDALLVHACSSTVKVIHTQGDKDQRTPLDRFPERGVFTKAIDQALLDGKADVAVHSLKDLPVLLPEGTQLVAVLPRDHWMDVLITKPGFQFDRPNTIATSSSRRKAQWKERYPKTTFVDIRGNMEVRMKKFASNAWDGLILSKAGLDRIGLLPGDARDLDWMIPAPGQGVIGICCRENDSKIKEMLGSINDKPTWECIHLERLFMRAIEMACQAPVGAIAQVSDGMTSFTGSVHEPDGVRIWQETINCPVAEAVPQVQAMSRKVIALTQNQVK